MSDSERLTLERLEHTDVCDAERMNSLVDVINAMAGLVEIMMNEMVELSEMIAAFIDQRDV